MSLSACSMDERATESPVEAPDGSAAPGDAVQDMELGEAEEAAPGFDQRSSDSTREAANKADRFAPPPPARVGTPAARDPLSELDRLEGRLVALGVAVPQLDANRPVGTKTARGREQEKKAGKKNKTAPKGSKGKAKPKKPSAAPGGGDKGGVEKAEKAEKKEAQKRRDSKDLSKDEDRKPGASAEELGSVGDRCAQLCEVAEAICSLETRLCELAEDHPDDDRYADACERAEQDCEVASNACQTCAG